MRSLDNLSAEHALVKSLLAALESAATRLGRNGDVPADLLQDLLGVLARCVEQVHMAKEEQVVFPYLHAHGLSRSTAVVRALSEQHEAIKVYGSRMRRCCDRVERGDRAAAEELSQTVRDFAELFREHMRIEEAYFYQLADDMVDGPDHAWVLARFREIERVADAAAARDRAERVLQRCATVLGQASPP